MTTDRTLRPELPPNAGLNTRQLDIEMTRDELAQTLDDMFATLNPAVQFRSHPGLVTGLVLAVCATAAGAIVLLGRGRPRGRR